MRDFAQADTGLASLRRDTRWCYTVFLGFCLVGYGVMAALAISRSGFSSQAIAAYYAGAESSLVYPKTYGELLEVTHFHLFSMPLLLLVQGHLFLMTAWPPRWKTTLLVAGAVGIALDLAAPWLIVYVGTGLAPIKNLARVLMGIAFTAFAAVPLWEMWIKAPRRETVDMR